VNATVLLDGLVKVAVNQIVLMHVTLVDHVNPVHVNANQVGVVKRVKNKNVQTNAQAKLKVHVTLKHLNVHAKKDGLVMTVPKKHALKTVMDMANAKPMVSACAKICGLVKVVNSQLAQIHAVDTVCALVTNVNATLNSKATIAPSDNAQMLALDMVNAKTKKITSANVPMVSLAKIVAGKNV
jgi:tricorn protease-like protein